MALASALPRLCPPRHRLRLRHSLRLPFARNFATMTAMPPIVGPTELAAALSASGKADAAGSSISRIIPVSAEWYLPNDSRRGRDEFARQHIPQARFFDLDAVKDEQSPYPHMLPSAAGFAQAMDRLRISRTDAVVLYDSPHMGLFSAPRAAWTFQVFGHPRVHVLDNFKLWTELGLPTESGEAGEAGETGSGYPVVEPNTGLVVGFDEMVRLAELGPAREGVEIIDARPGGRFRGTDPEPRPGWWAPSPAVHACVCRLTATTVAPRAVVGAHPRSALGPQTAV